MRVFLAVVPPQDVLDHLDLALAGARTGPAGVDESVRWAARDTWHLTAAFYGELPDAAVAPLREELATTLATLPAYRLELHGAGVFAHRTLWVGVGGDVAAQRAVVELAARAGEEVGAHPDGRDRHRAHLTVGRAPAGARPPGRARGARRGPAGPVPSGVDAVARALAVYQGPAWTVADLHLMRSQPGAGRGGGPLYTPLAALTLDVGGRR